MMTDNKNVSFPSQQQKKRHMAVKWVPIIFLVFGGFTLLIIWSLNHLLLSQIGDKFAGLPENIQNYFQYFTILALAGDLLISVIIFLFLGIQKRVMENLTADLNKFQLAVENASDHIIITDPEGIILYVNHAAELTTGFTRHEMLGTKAGVLWGKRMNHDFYQKLWHKIKTEKKTFTGDFNNHRKNGQNYLAEASISPILDISGKIKFFVGIERDITKATEIDRMKTEFISLSSHQMRTPLSAMKWFCELLLDGSAGSLNDEQRSYVQNIYISNQRIIELVNSLLDISRIESGRLTIEPITTDLSTLVSETLSLLDQQIKERRIQISTHVATSLPMISIDPKLISQVYLNLINNAVKYTPDAGKISITLSQDENNLISEITDTGAGIPKNQQPRVFERFFRADNVKKIATEGTGLGLYLTKIIVEASGGKIWFESQENIGSKFWFSLPKTGSVTHKGEVTLTGML